MKRPLLVLIGIALAATGAGVIVGDTDSKSAPVSGAACRPGNRMLTFSVDGDSHQALLHVPRKVTGPLPLVFAFHGAYDDARGTSVYYGLSGVADREHFVVLYPQASHDRFWELQPEQREDVDQLRTLLNRMERSPCVEPSRVYATGVSNGGGFTARLGCEMADRLAAIAPVAGGYDPLKRCKPARPLPLLEIHGTEDTVVPYEGRDDDRRGGDSGFLSVSGFLGQWTKLNGCRGGPKVSKPRRGVTRQAWDNCEGGSVVEHLKLAGTDHGWPGSHWSEAGKNPSPRHDPTGTDSAEEVWDFVSRFRLPPSGT